jgi:hypothetical protein
LGKYINYAENDPAGYIDLHGLQKYKPKMVRIEKPRDLVSGKMLHNLKEGYKTATIEFGVVAEKGLKSVGKFFGGLLKQGHTDPSDFHDSGSNIPGSGTTNYTGDPDLNSSGTSDASTADGGLTAIVDELPSPIGGGAEKDGGAGKFADFADGANSGADGVVKHRESNQEVPSGPKDTIKVIKLGDTKVITTKSNNELQ